MSFQSRFGPEEWLRPYTDETVKALAARGVKRLAVIAPGFAADCLETIEELAHALDAGEFGEFVDEARDGFGVRSVVGPGAGGAGRL